MTHNQIFEEIRKKASFLCVGLDTDPSYIPPEVLRLYDSAPEAALAYNLALIDATAADAACYKVQVAYYEAMGLEGLRTYAKTLKAIRVGKFALIKPVMILVEGLCVLMIR